jgi:hypothetical protein
MSLAFLYILFGETNTLIWILISPFILLTPYFLRLHLNYLKKSKKVSIEISKGSPMIKIFIENEVFEFLKTDIKQLIAYTSARKYRSPFIEYSYSRIILNDNRIFDISFMIIDPIELALKLSNVPTTTTDKFYPYIR